MSNSTEQPDIEKLKAKHAMEMSVLQGRYLSSQMRIATSVRARHRAEAILQQYLLVLFPDLFSRALGAQMSITEAGEYLYAHHLYDSDPRKLFRAKNAQTEEEAAPTSPTAPVVAEPGPAKGQVVGESCRVTPRDDCGIHRGARATTGNASGVRPRA